MDKLGHKKFGYVVNELNSVGLNLHTLLIIKLPDSRALRIMSRSLFLAMVLLALPSLLSLIKAASSGALIFDSSSDSDTSNVFNILPFLLRDLVDEGLIKKGNRGFVYGISDTEDDFSFLRESGIDLLARDHKQQKNIVAHQVFDFVFATSFQGMQVVDGILKYNGLVIVPLSGDPSNGLRLLSSYKIVYLRRFECTLVAMRKMGLPCGGMTSEVRRNALNGLEDVYLEPPRRVVSSRKIKFLPDLLKDSLDEYPRRVFISYESSAVDWFYNNYPMRHQEFEVYNMEVGVSNEGRSSLSQETSVSSWLKENVRREDYVVMKAEAQVVEEMLRDSTLFLVDELFLECKNNWQDGEDEIGSKRAYWQCLSLYGKVRDEGVAVHQWWN